MKNLVQCFTRTVVTAFLDSLDEKHPFEVIAAVMIQRLYEEQWGAPTLIGFYMTTKYADLLAASGAPDWGLIMEALRCGRDEHNEIDFILVSEEADSKAEFQLKRFGLGKEPFHRKSNRLPQWDGAEVRADRDQPPGCTCRN
jgi:hypothetical protein